VTAGYRRYALAAMTAVYMLNLVDRGLMILLLQDINEDLQLNDTQLGFLTGIAFGLFYATLGLPIARWADRGDRVTITSLAIGLWGITVMSCVAVTSYLQIVLARIAAAVGESGCKPPTYSLVGDYFPQPAERQRAMAIYLTGSPLAALVSFVVGGWLNEIYGWRLTFFIMGIPGLLLAAVIKFTLIEPRQGAGDERARARESPSMRLVLSTLWRRRSCRHLSIALILIYTMSLGLAPWYAAFMIRSHAMNTAELGVWFGLIFGVGGAAGTLLGGYSASRWFGGNERGAMRLCAVTVVALVPCFAAFLLVPHKHQALIALVPLIAVFNLFLGPAYALMQRLVAAEMRATALAVVMLLANVIGMGIGPQVVGISSDLLTPTLGTDGLRYAMLFISLVAVWGGYHFWRVGESVGQDLCMQGER
jgi:predicted MFS family arabinose efflux permease